MCGIWLYLSKLLKEQKFASTQLYDSFYKIKHRGPDRSKFTELNVPFNLSLGFHRLAIMDITTKGDQPFIYEHNDHTIYAMTNGEIYNHSKLAEKHNLQLKSGSDCEVVPLLYMLGGIEMVLNNIDGEWALMIVDIDHKTNKMVVHCARDQFGVRPMFYSEDDNGYGFCSEMKGLVDISSKISPLKPAHLMTVTLHQMDSGLISSVEYKKYYEYDYKINMSLSPETIKTTIQKLLTESIVSRLESDRPVGCLLSGGIDSSIVAAISAKYLEKNGKKLRTFSIGMENSPDVYYAKMVANHIGSIHTVVPFDPAEGIKMIPTVIKQIESYDITTVRASNPMWFLLQWIAHNTDIKVCLSGEYMDELAGSYLYLKNAPSSEEFHKECVRLVDDIYMFDSLRADRSIAGNGIEARVPYSSREFIEFYMSIDPKLRIPRPSEILGIKEKTEKALVREAFYGTGLLPDEVLTRIKNAFSDAITSDKKSWFQYIEEHVETIINDEEFKDANKYSHIVPTSKEALYYRKIFDELYCKTTDNSTVIPYYWLPKWCGDVKNPSARVLSVYKKENLNID